MKFAVACCGTLLLLSSCAKDRESSEPIIERTRHPVLEGSIESNILKVQESVWADKCEKNIRDIQLEIGQELDRRQAEIAALPVSSTAGIEKKKLSLGSITMIDLPKIPPASTGWQTDYSSWDDIISRYEKIKGTPTDAAWRSLNSYVRGVLSDDMQRVVSHFNFGIGKDSFAGLSSLEGVLQKCMDDENCVEPDYAPAAAFLSGQPFYDTYVGAIKRRTEKSEKREWISRFLRTVRSDLTLYDFYKNELMLRQDGESFVLPLDAGSFQGFQTEIQAFIERAWTSATGKKVKVEWRDVKSSPMLYSFLYSPVMGERAYVSHSKRTINLNANSSQSTVAHEVGHVMGFSDNYYTVWDEKNCRYISETREDDIMSLHQTGSVLPEHWQKLEQEYPVITR